MPTVKVIGNPIREVAVGSTVADALSAIGADGNGEGTVMVNGEPTTDYSATLSAGSAVVFVPAIKGA